MSEGFATDLRTAELFFRVCARYKISGHQERVALMREITRRGKAKYLRDVDAAIGDKKVAYVGKRRTPPHVSN